jgi:tripartite ATP-independent transporter DctP family solute receptor
MKKSFPKALSPVLVSLGLFCSATSAHAATNLVLGHGNSPNNPKSLAAAKFAEIVKEKSGGQVTISIEGAAKVGDDLAMVGALERGALDLSVNSQGTVATVVPELSALGLPYAFSTSAKAWEVLDGAVGKDLAEKLHAKDLILLGWMDNGIRQITNNRRAITKPDDLKGLKIRTTPDKSIMDIMTALGAIPMPMNFSNVFEALKNGYVDGQDNPLANIHSAKLHEVQKYISITNHNYSVAPFLMSRKSWEKLSSDQRKLLKDAAAEATTFQRKLMADSDVKLLAEYEKMPSVKVVKADQAAFKAATRKVWDSWELKPFGSFVKKLRAAAN